MQSYSVPFTAAPALVATLARAHAEGRLEDRLAFCAKPKLWTSSAICPSSPTPSIRSSSLSPNASSDGAMARDYSTSGEGNSIF
jgi:hypothetical protein